MKINEFAEHDLKNNSFYAVQGYEGRVEQVKTWLAHIRVYTTDLTTLSKPNDAFTVKVLERWLAVFS